MQKAALQGAPRKNTPVTALLCALCLGSVCIYLASLLLTSTGMPALFVNFIRKPDGTLPLYFFNSGKTELSLDTAGMQRFLFHPANGGNRYILHVRSKPFGVDEAENTRRLLALTPLPPKESLELGDMRSIIAALPNNTGLTLTAVYSGLVKAEGDSPAWGGEVRSLPLILREEKE
jgi:hypothetical protein